MKNGASVFVSAVLACGLATAQVPGQVSAQGKGPDASARAAPPPSSLRVAAVRDGAVCASLDGAALRCFGPASSRARLPVWSRNGRRIAYVDDANPANALAWLVVMDAQGQLLSRLPIKPLADGEVRSGMRFVEALEWTGPERVVVSGSINPSSTESLVFDLGRRAVVAEYVDDAHGASFSPDGRHVLLVEGAPHFATAAARAPVLSLDGRVVLEGLHADLAALGPVRWSADGARFALTARDGSGRLRLVFGHAPTGTARWVDLPAPALGADMPPTLFWSGPQLHLQRLMPSGGQGVGEGEAGGPSLEALILPKAAHQERWQRVAGPVTDPMQAAAALRSAVLARSLPPGTVDADVWCRACALDKVARRRSAGE